MLDKRKDYCTPLSRASIDISTSLSFNISICSSIDERKHLFVDRRGGDRKLQCLLQRVERSNSSQNKYQLARLAMLENPKTF